MNGVPMKFDYSKTINEQLPTFEYYKDRYCSYELELINDRKEIERLNKENKILRENAEHNDKVVDKVNWENKRLNNIMTELEIELYAKYHEYKDSECEELYAKAQEDKEILDYIKELKGSDKE